ncbi:MAG: D-alanyl-D-alanine carboxypeptidase/D-alanyl-D-alanine-endopeptidase, partial [Verrucomicrobia bacterium]|nr:D-alanyl-D-alanine carboxypeptidase/D-alanyl-D-alanine-endopeptidase [Prolixibacteraceae bacterium]
MIKQNMVIKVLTILLFILAMLNGSAQNTPLSIKQKITSWTSTPALTTASVGYAVSDSRTGEMLIQSEPQQSLVPASVLKLVTTATALELLGPDFRFETTLEAVGSIRNDTLFGDLQIIGGGDATLGSGYFPENNHFMDDWMKGLKSKNIKVVTGKLILDASIYESQTIPDTWIWEDIGNYYGAGVSGINLFDNLYEVHFTSPKEAGLKTRIKHIYPEVPGLELKNEVLSSDINRDQAFIYGSPGEYKRVIRGTIPKNKSDFVIKGSMPDPSALLALHFRKELAKNNISIAGETEYAPVKKTDDRIVLRVVNQSPALREIIKVTNFESVNLFAENFLKQISYKKSGLGVTKRGCQFITEFWKEKGIEMNGFYLSDGSGLSRFNAITPGQLVNILNYMKTKSVHSEA